MRTLRVAIVDDEAPARERLRMLLEEQGGVEIVAEAEDGETAIEKATMLSPDAIFLDIRMPGISGLEVAASLPSPSPRVVFCTAFDEYAVDAFELRAVDYLLKPVTRPRLEATLARLRAGEAPVVPAVAPPERFLAKRGSRWYVVPAGEVVAFLSEGSETKLRVEAEHYWVAPTLNDLEARLEGSRFYRVSRSAIVSLDAVREVVPLGGSLGEVILRNGDRLEVSRRRFAELMKRLG